MDEHRCPDCGVTMEEAAYGLRDARNPYVKRGEQKEGVLGALGAKGRTPVTAVVCPECGLVRQYADHVE